MDCDHQSHLASKRVVTHRAGGTPTLRGRMTFNMSIAHTILAIASLYLAAGIIFGCWFVTAGVARLDANARNAPFGFRILILPGTIALWPVLLAKSITMSRRRP